MSGDPGGTASRPFPTDDTKGDVTSGSDADALFHQYRATMAALEREFAKVRFVHVTTPLTTEPGLKAAIKKLLGRASSSRADNAARERLNRLMRQEYGPDRLFDLAAVESTAPDGTRVSGRFGGQEYFALYGGYAADDGHLLARGHARRLWQLHQLAIDLGLAWRIAHLHFAVASDGAHAQAQHAL